MYVSFWLSFFFFFLIDGSSLKQQRRIGREEVEESIINIIRKREEGKTKGGRRRSATAHGVLPPTRIGRRRAMVMAPRAHARRSRRNGRSARARRVDAHGRGSDGRDDDACARAPGSPAGGSAVISRAGRCPRASRPPVVVVGRLVTDAGRLVLHAPRMPAPPRRGSTWTGDARAHRILCAPLLSFH